MKRTNLLLLILAILKPMMARADPVEINGIYYNLVSKNEGNFAEVTSRPENYSGDVVIPALVTYADIDYSVTSIGLAAFFSCTNLTSIIIPNSVTSIGRDAFYYSSGLSSITIPHSVTNIDDYAFGV